MLHLHAQGVAVALIVCSSALYAGWTLMPAALRSRVANLLLRWHLPPWCQTRLRRLLMPAAGACGGCGGCDSGSRPATSRAIGGEPVKPPARPLVFHPRRSRH